MTQKSPMIKYCKISPPSLQLVPGQRQTQAGLVWQRGRRQEPLGRPGAGTQGWSAGLHLGPKKKISLLSTQATWEHRWHGRWYETSTGRGWGHICLRVESRIFLEVSRSDLAPSLNKKSTRYYPFCLNYSNSCIFALFYDVLVFFVQTWSIVMLGDPS